MKIRKGFVSNSSSTSFTCDMCGDSETFYDGCSPIDMGFYRCRNEHVVCVNCLDNGDSTKTEDDDWWGTVINEEDCPICRFEVISDFDMKRYLYKLYKIEEPEVLEDIKKVNKRRRKVYEKDYINYVCLKFNLQILTLVSEIKEKFENYDKFWEFIK